MTGEEKLLASLLLKMPGTEFEDDTPRTDEWNDFLAGRRKSISAESLKQIWFSPDHREAYLEMRKKHFEQQSLTLANAGYFQQTFRKAADSNVSHDEISGTGFTLELTRVEDGTWMLFLEIEASLIEAFGPTANWHLEDSGGLVWMSGQADDGIMEAIWKLNDQTPVDRLRENSISIRAD